MRKKGWKLGVGCKMQGKMERTVINCLTTSNPGQASDWKKWFYQQLKELQVQLLLHANRKDSK